jgi:hypothetical protein
MSCLRTFLAFDFSVNKCSFGTSRVEVKNAGKLFVLNARMSQIFVIIFALVSRVVQQRNIIVALLKLTHK